MPSSSKTAPCLFDLAQSKYSISGEHNKCLLHVWSSERNVVRRVSKPKSRTKPSASQCSAWDNPGPPSSRSAANATAALPRQSAWLVLAYQRVLQRVLQRRFPSFQRRPAEHVDGPRALLRPDLLPRIAASRAIRIRCPGRECAGNSGLHRCRADLRDFVARRLPVAKAGKVRASKGSSCSCPPGHRALTRERMAHLNPQAAKWHLYELEERDDKSERAGHLRLRQRCRLAWCTAPTKPAPASRFASRRFADSAH